MQPANESAGPAAAKLTLERRQPSRFLATTAMLPSFRVKPSINSRAAPGLRGLLAGVLDGAA
jgi:hypothetical protein